MTGYGFVGTFFQDIGYAFRVLRKNPGFTVVAILSLALGIGANTGVFSVINAVLLRPLPYSQSGQLVRVSQQGTEEAVTLIEYEFWKEHSTTFSSMAGHFGVGERGLTSRGGQKESVKVMTVTADFLKTFAIDPVIGREFNSEETRVGGPQAIILTDGLWRQNFGADTQVLGSTVTLDNVSYTVIGVLPRSYWFPQAADALIPLRATGDLGEMGTNTEVIARLRDDVSINQAQAEMAKLTESFRSAYASQVKRDYRGLMVSPYQDWLVGKVRLNLILLFSATGLLLLMACSNLAGLLLTRLTARQKEVAVRLALGSSNGRLLWQFLLENLVLGAIGTVVGIFVAYALLRAFLAVVPFNLPSSRPIGLDLTVLVFTFVVFLVAAFLFTLAPFFTAVRLNVQEALKSGVRTAGTGNARQHLRNFLVVSAVALSAMLLIAAGLLIHSLYKLHQEQLGFVPDGLITFETPLTADRYPGGGNLSNFTNTMVERLRALPGVRGIAAINLLPLTGLSNFPAQRDGHPEQSIGGMEIRVVTPGYFEVMGVPVRRGRAIERSDTGASAPIVLINETLAWKWWPSGGAVGDRITIGRFRARDFPQIKDVPREVVGIVADTKTSNLKQPPSPTVFIPAAQASDITARMTGKIAWIVSTQRSIGIVEEVRHVIAGIESTQQIRNFRTMSEIVNSTISSSRFDAWLFGVFASAALALAALGVYGVVSFSVAQRRQEIGTRMALGASRADILMLVLKHGLLLTAVGLGFGLLGALLVTRSISSLLFGVRPDDALSFLSVSFLLLLIGGMASLIPSLRATKIDPMISLRYE